MTTNTMRAPANPLIWNGQLSPNRTILGEAKRLAAERENRPPPAPKVTPHRIHEVPGKTAPVGQPAKAPVPKAINDGASPQEPGQDGRGAATAPKAASDPAAPPKVSKGDIIIHLLYRPQGATNAEMREATGWQSHTVRGFLGGVLRKKGIPTESAVEGDRGRVYRAMVEEAV